MLKWNYQATTTCFAVKWKQVGHVKCPAGTLCCQWDEWEYSSRKRLFSFVPRQQQQQQQQRLPANKRHFLLLLLRVGIPHFHTVVILIYEMTRELMTRVRKRTSPTEDARIQSAEDRWLSGHNLAAAAAVVCTSPLNPLVLPRLVCCQEKPYNIPRESSNYAHIRVVS